jgi:hypothetical protein
MKWTGTNTTDFKAWVQSLSAVHTFTDDEWQEQDSGDGTGSHNLYVNFYNDGYAFMSMSVTTGAWAVFGPYWGDDPTLYWAPARNPWDVSTDADFGRRFTIS